MRIREYANIRIFSEYTNMQIFKFLANSVLFAARIFASEYLLFAAPLVFTHYLLPFRYKNNGLHDHLAKPYASNLAISISHKGCSQMPLANPSEWRHCVYFGQYPIHRTCCII